MNITQLELTNFLSHKNTVIRLHDGLTGVVGPNGSGKSSLIKDSITWCLWGKSRREGAGDELIHDTEDQCSVSVYWTSGNRNYKVIRTRVRDKKTTLELYILNEGEAPTNTGGVVLKDTQEKINSVLGMNYEVFRNSCCIEQGKSDTFSNLSPKEAADMILSILQLDTYKVYKMAATDKCVIAKMELDKRLGARTLLKANLDTMSDLEKAKTEKEKELQNFTAQYDRCKEKFDKANAQGHTIALQSTELSQLIQACVSTITANKSTIGNLGRRLEAIKKSDGACPLCKSSLTEDHRKEVLAQLKYEISGLESGLEAAENSKTMFVKALRTKEIELGNLKLDEKSKAISKLESAISEVQGSIKTLGLTSSMSEAHRLYQTNEDAIETLEIDVSIYDALNAAFSSRGIPLLIMDSVLKELEVLVNSNLRLLTDLPITLELKTQRESAAGELLDTFQILITNGLMSRSYFNYSGGEKLLIDLALRLGLSELLARRNNFKVETLIIDEGLGSLDEANQANFISTLNSLTSKFKKVLVITHTAVKDEFVNQMQISIGNGVSVVD